MVDKEYLKNAQDINTSLEKDEPRATRRIGNIELRYDSHGEIDEILLFADNGVFHMERMDGGSWWFGLDDDENGFSIHTFMMLRGLPSIGLAHWPDEEKGD